MRTRSTRAKRAALVLAAFVATPSFALAQSDAAPSQVAKDVVHIRLQPGNAAVAAPALVGEAPVGYSQDSRYAAA